MMIRLAVSYLHFFCTNRCSQTQPRPTPTGQTSSTQTPMGSSPQSSSAAPPSIEGRAPLSQPTSSTTTSNPVKTDSVAKSRDDEPPAGSCPGDGVCNGAGGKTCCNGCPAYNNKIYTAHRHADGSNGRARKVKPESAGQEGASLQEEDTAAVASSSTAGPQQPQQQQQHHQQQQQQAAPTAAAATSAVGNTSDAGGPKPPTEAFGGMACENCGTRTTPLWRRDGQGKVACNVRAPSFAPKDDRKLILTMTSSFHRLVVSSLEGPP